MTDYILRDFVNQAKHQKKTIGDIILEYEEVHFQRKKEEILKRLQGSFTIFEEAVKKGLDGNYTFTNLMFNQDSTKLQTTHYRLLGGVLHTACVYALAITENNLNMGRVIACPTAGSSGIVPACILAVSEEYGSSDIEKYKALLAAAAVELSIVKNASISGAVHGCQAECGSASAMAAAGIVQLMNPHPSTNPDMIDNAAALALKNSLGLVCDPVAGVVSVPCRKRNATAVGTAFISAQLALAGIASYVPFDEVASAMHEIGDRMDTRLKETARGGLARTKSGREWETVKDNLLHEAIKKHKSYSDILVEKIGKSQGRRRSP
jgi:L-serine dehydratase